MPVIETCYVVEIVATPEHEDGELQFMCKESAEKYLTASFAKGFFQYPISSKQTDAITREQILPVAHAKAIFLEEWEVQ